MGEKDTTEKVLVDYNDVFADIINVLVFNGELIVSESELDNTSVHAQYKVEDGIENQEKPDINMPFRIIGYDGASYRSQLLDDRKSIVPDDNRVIQHVDAVLKLLSVVTGDNKYESILYDKEQRGRVSRMCEVAERLVNKGIEQNQHTVIINMLKENEPVDKICRITECDEACVLKIKAELNM